MPALPQGACAAMALVDIQHVISAHVLHQPGDRVFLLRCHQQVHMVGHEYVGVQLNAKATQPLSQQLQIEQVIIITEEADYDPFNFLTEISITYTYDSRLSPPPFISLCSIDNHLSIPDSGIVNRCPRWCTLG